MHTNLFIAFHLRALSHFTSMSFHGISTGTLNPMYCNVLYTIQIYFIQASYTWVFIEALFLHNIIFIHVMNEHKIQLIIYYIIGWTLPLIFLIIWIVFKSRFESPKLCWSSRSENPEKQAKWLETVYPAITIFCNVVLFINIIRVLFIKLRTQPNERTNRHKKLVKSTLVLVMGFGLYYLISLPVTVMELNDPSLISKDLDLVKLYYDHSLSCFQGLLVSLLFCFLNTKVRRTFWRKFERLRYRHGNPHLSVYSNTNHRVSRQFQNILDADENGFRGIKRLCSTVSEIVVFNNKHNVNHVQSDPV